MEPIAVKTIQTQAAKSKDRRDMKTKGYKSVAEAFSDIVGEEHANELGDQMRSRRVIKALCGLRTVRGVTQQDIANQLGTTQSKVSKLENGVDADLRFRELEAYAKSTDSDVTILISPRGKSLAEQIKYHACSIRAAFLELAELAHKDESVARGVADLHAQAFCNLNRFLQETSEKLPLSPENGTPYVRIAPCDIELGSGADESNAVVTTHHADRGVEPAMV